MMEFWIFWTILSLSITILVGFYSNGMKGSTPKSIAGVYFIFHIPYNYGLFNRVLWLKGEI